MSSRLQNVEIVTQYVPFVGGPIAMNAPASKVETRHATPTYRCLKCLTHWLHFVGFQLEINGIIKIIMSIFNHD